MTGIAITSSSISGTCLILSRARQPNATEAAHAPGGPGRGPGDRPAGALVPEVGRAVVTAVMTILPQWPGYWRRGARSAPGRPRPGWAGRGQTRRSRCPPGRARRLPRPPGRWLAVRSRPGGPGRSVPPDRLRPARVARAGGQAHAGPSDVAPGRPA